MDDSQDIQDEKTTSNLLPRHRSPVFSKDEVKMLINIIDKYKTIILNKSTNTASCHAKEIAWSKITKTYNSQGFKHNRHTDSLKVKWDNLKKEARKFAKNVMDVNQSEFSDVISQIVGMMAEAENNNSEIEVSPETYEDLKELENQKVPKENEIKFSDDNGDEDSGDDTMDTSDLEDERQTNHKGTLLLKKRLRNNRAMNFSPEESNLLLKCVRAEKKYVFRRDTTEKANKSKNAAWTRITEAYNRQSTQKRATKVLHTKFSNMKRMAKKLNIKDYLEPRIKRTKLFEENRNKRIKSEPALELDNEPIDDGDFNEIHNMDSHLENDNVEHTPDPLSTVLNGEDRLDTLINGGLVNPIENKEIVKLKMELIKYQIENAKLEKRRIEDAMRAEAASNEARCTETALRLRAARLDAIAAEMKLPPGHPALQYTAEETRAQAYINHYQT